MEIVDDVLVAAGICWLVARQFQWRRAAGMPRTGLVLLVLGVASAVQDALLGGARWTAADAAALAAELVLAAVLGAVMGGRYRFRAVGDRVLARLGGSGAALWAAFVLLRLASFEAAHLLGAGRVTTSGALLLAFGANRLATGLVVRRRLVASGGRGPFADQWRSRGSGPDARSGPDPRRGA